MQMFTSFAYLAMVTQEILLKFTSNNILKA
jgi:hypothetical protein